jgi:D-sedoheptulose 7-phosphate isomerase
MSVPPSKPTKTNGRLQDEDTQPGSVFLENIAEHQNVIQDLVTLDGVVLRVGFLAADILRKGGKILFCGNGGSAADSQHLAAELTGRLSKDRPPIAAIALSTDTSALTCIGNDYSFDEVFARQVVGLGRKNDLLIAISTSGQSVNIVRAVEEARKLGILTVGLLGCSGGIVSQLCKFNIIVPSKNTARIQECHILIGHTICELIEKELTIACDLGIHEI